jgi:hypothetical protein
MMPGRTGRGIWRGTRARVEVLTSALKTFRWRSRRRPVHGYTAFITATTTNWLRPLLR